MARTVCGIGDDYLPASFNGVQFHCIEATSEHGRRGAEGEFPFGEITGYADLGRRIRTYTLSGMLRDNDHVLQTALLIAACEIPGPGILVHPTRGVINAACRSISVRDNLEDEAGITYVDLEFVEGNIWPNGLSLVGSLLGLALGAIIGTSSTSFRSRYVPRSVSPVRRWQVIDVGQNAVLIVADQYERAIQTQNNYKKWQALSDLRNVQDDDVLASDPETMDQALSLGMAALATELDTENKFRTFKGFANWAARATSLPGSAGDAEDAVYSHVRIMAAAYMGQAATSTTYNRMNDAIADLDSIVAILDDESANARNRCDNELFLEIENFKIQVQTTLYERTYNVPRLVEYNFAGGVHPLVAAYSLYGDAKRHRELELRNVLDANGRMGPLVVGATT